MFRLAVLEDIVYKPQPETMSHFVFRLAVQQMYFLS